MEGAAPVWEFDDTPNGWRAYAPPVVALLEQAVEQGKTEAEYKFGSWTYTVYFQDPANMTQMNMATGTLRTVRRTPPLAAPEPAPAADDDGDAAMAEAGPELPPWLSAADDAALRDLLLSEAAATERPPSGDGEDAKVMSEAELNAVLQKHVPGVEGMMDRTGQVPVATYIVGTYNKGLPIYNGSPVQQHTIRALRTVFELAAADKPGSPAALQQIAQAFQSCQAEQGRTIDAQYGRLTGRDASFRDQFLSLVDGHKTMVLQEVVCELNPQAAEATDAHPQAQVPHITSAYLVATGTALGFRGVAAARADQNAPPLAPHKGAEIAAAIRAKFSVADVVEALIADVNQQAEDAERVIDRDALAAWASTDATGDPSIPIPICFWFGGDQADLTWLVCNLRRFRRALYLLQRVAGTRGPGVGRVRRRAAAAGRECLPALPQPQGRGGTVCAGAALHGEGGRRRRLNESLH